MCNAGRSLDDTVEDVKEIPPVQRGMSSMIGKLGSKGSRNSWSGKDYMDDRPTKTVDDAGHSGRSTTNLAASKDASSAPHELQQS